MTWVGTDIGKVVDLLCSLGHPPNVRHSDSTEHVWSVVAEDIRCLAEGWNKAREAGLLDELLDDDEVHPGIQAILDYFTSSDVDHRSSEE